MSESTPDAGRPQGAAEVEQKTSRGVSLVWVIPIIAAVIGGGIAYDTYQKKGPVIQLTFQDGSGIEAGKTTIKYRSIEIGVVRTVTLSEDMQTVIASAELDKESAPYLTDQTIFWKVSPHVGLSGISGLDTLMSGDYLGVLPSKEGTPSRAFDVQPQAPPIASHQGALAIVLTSKALGSVSEGSPIVYRSIQIGEVSRYELVEGGLEVRIHALIDAPYTSLVHQGSQFWNASGLDVTLGADGLQVHANSLASLLQGGITIETPEFAMDSGLAEAGQRFVLYDDAAHALRAREQREGLNVFVEAHDGGSISEGSPVFYRKQQVGHVGTSELSDDARSVRFQLHIDARYAPLVRQNTRFWNASGIDVHVGLDGLDLRTDSLGSILSGGIEFATPNRPGKPAERDAMFVMHEEPNQAWLAWSPSIWVGDGEPQQVAHVLKPASAKPAGLRFILESFVGGSVKAGDAIYYREMKVGVIEDTELAGDAKTVRIRARVYPQYATLVRKNSRFWNASGIDVSLGLSGLDIHAESLESLLEGGVAFATPDQPGGRIDAGSIFPLHANAQDEWHDWSPNLMVNGASPSKPIEHAIHPSEHAHLFGRPVSSEVVGPHAAAIASQAEPVSGSGECGFLRSLFTKGC